VARANGGTEHAAVKRGARYTIAGSVDTLILAGVVKATKKIVVGGK
jgi:hypothetical protein